NRLDRLAGLLQDERDLVDHSPRPLLARLYRAHDGVIGLPRMPAGVLVRRRVAAADITARLAHPQVHPAAAGLQALLADGDVALRLEVLHLVEMRPSGHVLDDGTDDIWAS